MDRLLDVITHRFGASLDRPPEGEADAVSAASSELERLANHRSHRVFTGDAPSLDLLKLIAAVALSSPSKSDLQQRDILIVQDPVLLQNLKALVSDQAWTRSIHTLTIFLGNNRRQRQLHDMRGHSFANDHLDAFMNAAVDAGIALQSFITAAEAVGLGCCPLSAIRNRPRDVARLLELPDHVFPVAGLAIGWPSAEAEVSLRLPLDATVHVDRFDDARIADHVAAYDARRAAHQPYGRQRGVDRFGALPAARYTWSEDKTRQYAEPERADFGAYIANIGFKLA